MYVFSGAPRCTRATDNANLFWLHLRSMDENADVEPPEPPRDAEPKPKRQRKKGDRSGPSGLSGRSGKSNWSNAKRPRRKSPEPAAIPETPPEAFDKSKNEEVVCCDVGTQTPSWVRRVRLVSPLDATKDIGIGF